MNMYNKHVFSTFLVTEVRIKELLYLAYSPFLLRFKKAFTFLCHFLNLFFSGLPHTVNICKAHLLVNVSTSRNTLLNRLNQPLLILSWIFGPCRADETKKVLCYQLCNQIFCKSSNSVELPALQAQMNAERIAKICKINS